MNLLTKYFNPKRLMIFLILVELIWIVLSIGIFILDYNPAKLHLPFVLLLNVLTLLPFPLILKKMKRLHQNIAVDKNIIDLWDNSVFGFFVISNVLLMVFIIWEVLDSNLRFIYT